MHDGKVIKALRIQVNHPNYGTLFSALVKGSGILISETDGEGVEIPFLTTEQILEQLAKFGFLISYDVKSNLPNETLNFLATVDNLGFDKITKVTLQDVDYSGKQIWRTRVIVMKSEYNTDLLTFGCKITQRKYNEKLSRNYIMNVTEEDGIQWDWVSYMANISDILEENIDPVDEFETETNAQSHNFTPYISENLTPYVDPEDEESEFDEGGE